MNAVSGSEPASFTLVPITIERAITSRLCCNGPHLISPNSFNLNICNVSTKLHPSAVLTLGANKSLWIMHRSSLSGC